MANTDGSNNQRAGQPGRPQGRGDRRDRSSTSIPAPQTGSASAAVPWYVGRNFNSAPPGHRYLLYLPFWKRDWKAIKEGKHQLLKDVGKLPHDAQEMMRQLAARQYKLGRAAGAEIIEARSVSPFATGLGWEHPNENGFAFLQPYGLPYLAGSGVKGVVRKAAEELALFGDDGQAATDERWTMLDVWWLFGFEGASGAIWATQNEWATAFGKQTAAILERPDLSLLLDRLGIPKNGSLHQRLDALKDKRTDLQLSGALRFFDVIPELKSLDVDIMNPHYGDYYQRGKSPHDAGSPIPIFFLVVPPESTFTFVVDCPREGYLPEHVREKWRQLLPRAFQYTFDWLGFGAKTAVGYGAIRSLSKEELHRTHEKAQADSIRCEWVDQTLEEIAKANRSSHEESLRGRLLAERWQSLQDVQLKKRALRDIQFRWEKKGWWNDPPGKAARIAKKIYEGQSPESNTSAAG